ncbi:MAG: radical SAM protein [Anaerolineales bacterium]
MGYSVGIGLTNDCNLNCAHCYRDTQTINYISLDQVKKICDSIPVDAIGMGTGENILNPEFIEIASYLNQIGVKLSIASNGHSLTTAPEHILKMFSDVELSIDFPTENEQDTFRGLGIGHWCMKQSNVARIWESRSQSYPL